jgi:hypothetical protein
MSGVAGGNRIEKRDVQRTFDKYVKDILEKIPGFKKASLSGSVKTGTKPDYGDLDLITWFEGEDKREVKQRIIEAIQSQPDSVIVPFKSEKYVGKKYYNSGEIITNLFPIEGKQDKYIQVDNIIALTEEEHGFKNNFLDLPAEKQGLILGLVKVVLLEKNPQDVLQSLDIQNIPTLEDDEELEFNLSSGKLTLRKVKLKDYKTVKREDIWSSTNWEDIKKLLQGFNTEGSFEDILKDIKVKLKNPRSKNRIKGIFNSMISVKSGEVGTPKGDNKEKALNSVNTLLELKDINSIGLYAGGFKPPHKAHFNNAKFLASKVDKLIIFIGPKIREGVKVTAEQSKEIWEIYSKYINTPIEIHISDITPIRDIYDFAEQNTNKYNKIVTGALPEEMKKFAYFEKNKDKFNNVEILQLPRIGNIENKFSATTIRGSVFYLRKGEWIPSILSKNDKEAVINIAMTNTPSEKEIQMQEALDNSLDNLFNSEQEVKEGMYGAAIAPTGVIQSSNRAKLVHLYKELVNTVDKEEFEVGFNQDHISIKNKDENKKLGYDYTPYMASILEYMIDEGMNILPLPEIKVKEDITESANFFGKTAYYDPNSKEVVLYVKDRHPKDVMRSFAHEMIHHLQNLEGRLGGVATSNTNEDSSLMELEKEAYLQGNMTFRNWEDKIKNVEETNRLKEAIKGDKIECDKCGWRWNIADGGDDLFICHKCGHDNKPIGK